VNSWVCDVVINGIKAAFVLVLEIHDITNPIGLQIGPYGILTSEHEPKTPIETRSLCHYMTFLA
jgi:hypothetical protein